MAEHVVRAGIGGGETDGFSADFDGGFAVAVLEQGESEAGEDVHILRVLHDGLLVDVDGPVEVAAGELLAGFDHARNFPRHEPEPDRFLKLATRSKHFIDTIKIIAYRAETALSQIVREQLNTHHQDEARALIRDICTPQRI